MAANCTVCLPCGGVKRADANFCSDCMAAMVEIVTQEDEIESSDELKRKDSGIRNPYRRRTEADQDDLVTMVSVKSPGKILNEKFLKASLDGEVVDLLTSSPESTCSDCVFLDVQTAEHRIQDRLKEANMAGNIISIQSSPEVKKRQASERPNASI